MNEPRKENSTNTWTRGIGTGSGEPSGREAGTGSLLGGAGQSSAAILSTTGTTTAFRPATMFVGCCLLRNGVKPAKARQSRRSTLQMGDRWLQVASMVHRSKTPCQCCQTRIMLLVNWSVCGAGEDGPRDFHQD